MPSRELEFVILVSHERVKGCIERVFAIFFPYNSLE